MEVQEYEAMRLQEDTFWWYAQLRKRLLKAVRGAEGSPSKILDVGCGTGGNMAFLAANFPEAEIFGFDLSDCAAEKALGRPLKGVTQASVQSIPFAAETFDTAVCLDVLYHRSVEEKSALREIHRVLRPGGMIFLNVPAFEALRGRHDEAVHTRRRYRLPELQTLLQEAGFEIRFLTYWNAFLFPAFWFARSISRVLPAGEHSDVRSLSPFLSRLLNGVLDLELLFFPRPGLPLGTSLFAAAVKPLSDEN